MPDNRKPLIYGAFPVCRNYTVRAHLRDHGHLQRRGCENPVQYAGSFQRRVYTGHLYAHHQRYAARRSGENRRLHGIGHGNHHPGTSRPTGGKPVQGDPVLEGGIKQTTPKGRDNVPWASIFCREENFLIFCAGQRITSEYSSHLRGIQLRNFQNYFCFRHHDSKNPRSLRT